MSVLAAAVLAFVPAASAVLPSEPVRAEPSQRGSVINFFGWSRNSRFIAYTRQRVGRTQPEQRMHRLVEAGRFAGFGTMVGGEVERFAREHGYRADAAPRRRVDEARFDFAIPSEPAVLEMQIGRAQRWRLSRGGAILAEHTFDRIYVGFDAELYPAPDGTQGVLVMHLDTGWEIDAAVFPVRLEAGKPSDEQR